MKEKLVSLTEYAKLHGLARETVVQRARRGAYKTARKVGATYVIDANEPHIDHRTKTGDFVGWREKYPSRKKKAEKSE